MNHVVAFLALLALAGCALAPNPWAHATGKPARPLAFYERIDDAEAALKEAYRLRGTSAICNSVRVERSAKGCR